MASTRRQMMRGQRGFTIIELMLVVSIVGMMVAIATPNFMSMMYRSKRMELVTVTDGIYMQQIAHNNRHDTYVSAPTYYPRETLTKAKVEWPSGGEMETIMDFRPDGYVAGKYMTDTTSVISFEIVGEIDVDGDGQNAVYQVTYTEEQGGIKEQGWMTGTDVY